MIENLRPRPHHPHPPIQSGLFIRVRGFHGHGTLGGYVILGEETDYRRLVETVVSRKQAA